MRIASVLPKPELPKDGSRLEVQNLVALLSHDWKRIAEALLAAKAEGPANSQATDASFAARRDDLAREWKHNRDQVARRADELERLIADPKNIQPGDTDPETVRDASKVAIDLMDGVDSWTRVEIVAKADALWPYLKQANYGHIYMTSADAINARLAARGRGSSLSVKAVLGEDAIDDELVTKAARVLRENDGLVGGVFVDDDTVMKVDRSLKGRLASAAPLIGINVVPFLLVLIADRNNAGTGFLKTVTNHDEWSWVYVLLLLALLGSLAGPIIRWLTDSDGAKAFSSRIFDLLSINDLLLWRRAISVWVALALAATIQYFTREAGDATEQGQILITPVVAFVIGYSADAFVRTIGGQLNDSVKKKVDAILGE